MAKEIVEKTICDRCGKVAETPTDQLSGGNDTKQAPTFYIEANGKKVVELEDLCKKCEDRVNGLIEDIKLEKSAKEKNPADKKSKGKDTSSKKGKDSKSPQEQPPN